MIGFVIYLKNLHLILIISISAIIYFLVILAIKGIGKEEINLLQSLTQKK